MNVLIVGYGSIGKRHFNILSSFKEVISCHVVTKQVLNTIHTFTSLKNVDLDNYEYIVIASKTYLHFEQLEYIENNTKNKIILLEKPMFLKNESIEIKNNHVFVGYNRRYYPIIQKINELMTLDICYLINVFTGQYLPFWREGRNYQDTYSAKKSEGGGVLLDLSHEIDYISYLCGEITIFSAINTKISDLEIDSDDVCIAIGKTERGTLVNFSIDYISKDFVQRVILHLKGSTIVADLKEMSLKQIFVDKSEKYFSFNDFDRNYSFEQMHRDILFSKSPKCSTCKDGMVVMRKIEDIKRLSNER